jgi:hypothetical protein
MRSSSRFAGATFAALVVSGSLLAAAPAQATVAVVAAKAAIVAPTATALAGDASVKVSWTTAGTATSYYRVFRSTTSTVTTTGTPVKDKLSATTRSWTNTGLTNGTYYYYRVVAVSGSVTKTSGVVHAKPLAAVPIAPSAVTATAAAGSVTVQWVAGAHTTGFKVYRSTSTTVPTTGTPQSGTVALAAATLTFKDSTVAASTTYYYVVVASGPGGTTASATVPATTPDAPPVAPGIPTGVTATVTGTSIVVGWTSGSATAGFEVYRSTSTPVATTGTPLSGASTLSATTFTDTSAVAGTTYSYVVVAIGNPTATATALTTTSAAATATVPVVVVPPGTGKASLVYPAATLTSTVDQPTAGVVTVTNVGKGVLSVSAVTLSGTSSALAQFSLTQGAFTLAPGASQDVAVMYTPITTEKISVNVVVTSDDATHPTLTSTVKGVGTVGGFGALQPTANAWATAIGQTFAPLLGSDLTGLRMVFNRIGFDDVDKTATLHTQPTATETLTNTGTDPVTITDLSTTGAYNGIANWSITSAPTLPITLAPGDALSVTLQFDYCRLSCTFTTHPADGVVYGTLVVTSDDPGHETSTILLAGGWQASEGGTNELPLATWVNQILGITTVISTGAQPINSGNGAVSAVGDEVLSTSWQALDPTQPVNVRQIVATHGAGAHEPFYWYTGHNAATSKVVFQQAATDYQTVLPGGSSSSNAEGTFAPGTTVFELQVNNSDYSDDILNPTSNDIRHGCTGACGHHVRFYPVKDATGTVVPGLYLMAVDTLGANLDFNDEVYLISNVTPATS